MFKKITLFLLLLSISAVAQINVDTRPTKTQFVAHEPVSINIILTNRTGRDVVLKGDGLKNWLNINVYENGKLLPYFGKPPAYKGVLIPAGQSVTKKVFLSQNYNLTRFGRYNYTVSVTLPGNTNQAVKTPSRQFSISDARVLASQKIGTPGTKTARTYEVMRLNGVQKAIMYLKITDDYTKRVVICRPLSQIIPTKKPKVALDAKNELHLLYLVTNSIYVHIVTDATGSIKKTNYHKKGAYEEPRFVTFANGEVKVSGTVPYDPEAEKKKAEESRKLSERPEFR